MEKSWLREKGLKEVTRLTRAGIGDNGYQSNGRLGGTSTNSRNTLGRCESGEE